MTQNEFNAHQSPQAQDTSTQDTSTYSTATVYAVPARLLRPRAFMRVLWTVPVLLVLFLVAVTLGSSRALAAEIVGTEIYRLEAGQVVADDLYITAREVFIDGTVDGDLVVLAGYVEVNGLVRGDLIAAGAGVVVNGVVGDDARLAAGGVVISGTIADDLFVGAGGGQWSAGAVVWNNGLSRTVAPGLRVLDDASVTGDLYSGGGSGQVAGSIGRHLFAAFDSLVLAANVAGDATIQARELMVTDEAYVGGDLRYSAEMASGPVEGVGTSVVVAPWNADVPDAPNPAAALLWWLLRTIMLIIGLALLAWLLLRFFPKTLDEPAAAIAKAPVEATLWGVVLVALAVPLAIGLALLASIFWNWFPGGVAVFAFAFGAFGLIWIVSPLITGFWLGRWAAERMRVDWSQLTVLLLGMLAVVLTGRILALVPCVGAVAYRLVYLISLALAVGGWALARRRGAEAAPRPLPVE